MESAIDAQVARARQIYGREKEDLELFDKKLKGAGADQSIKPTFCPDVIELWLNSTLGEAVAMEIPGVLLQPDSQQPLKRYKVSKDDLIAEGLHPDKASALHRSLFAHSLGFYEALRGYCANTTNPNLIQSNLWKVFCILLEYCSKANYQT